MILEMKVVVFGGGLGNQLFQYMFYTYLTRKYGKGVYSYYRGNLVRFYDHNGFEVQNYFDIQIGSSLVLDFLVKMLERFRFQYNSSFALNFYVT